MAFILRTGTNESPQFVRRLGGLFPAQSRITQLIHNLGVSGLAFRRCTAITGEESVKAKTRTTASRPLSFAAGVGRALLPQLSYAEERATGREYLLKLKLWRKAIHFLRPREQTAFQMRNRLQAGTRRNCTSG